MEYLNEKDKYALLQEIDKNIETKSDFSEEELSILNSLSKYSDSAIRYEVARILINFTDKQGERILIQLTRDIDPLVRSEACDSLSVSEDIDTFNLLKNIVESDIDYMVRGYAISSIGYISQKLNLNEITQIFLENHSEKEQDIFPKINLYQVLYTLGMEKYLYLLAEEINTEQYQNRCAVVHCLEEVLNENNNTFIKTTLISRKEIEPLFAVTSTIDETLKNGLFMI